MCFIKVIIQRQWYGEGGRQTTHKALVPPCAMPCTTLHWRPRGLLLCFGRSHCLSADVSQSHDYRVTAEQAEGAALAIPSSKQYQCIGGSGGEGEGLLQAQGKNTSWNVVGFTKHKREHRNHQEASLNCGNKEEPSFSRPRTICNTFNKGSQSVGMEQHCGCQARCVLYRLWLSSCSPAKWRRATWVHWSGDFVHTGIFLCLYRVKRSWDTQNPQT